MKSKYTLLALFGLTIAPKGFAMLNEEQKEVLLPLLPNALSFFNDSDMDEEVKKDLLNGSTSVKGPEKDAVERSKEEEEEDAFIEEYKKRFAMSPKTWRQYHFNLLKEQEAREAQESQAEPIEESKDDPMQDNAAIQSAKSRKKALKKLKKQQNKNEKEKRMEEEDALFNEAIEKAEKEKEMQLKKYNRSAA